MNSPAVEQQESEDLNDMIAQEFDRMESEDVDDSEDEIEIEAEAEVEEETAESAEEEFKEEVEEAAESDYNEPAPERWPAEMQEVYNGLPPQARKAMLEGVYKPMQRKYTQTTQELAEMRNNIAPMLETVDQYRNDFERMGVSPQEAFRTQMAWAVHIQRVGAEKGLADMQAAYGVGTPQKAEGQEYLTPTERAMKAQLETLQKQVEGQQQYVQQTTQQQQQQAQVAYQNQIKQNLDTFINEKTEDGKLAHPHMEKVASNIAGIIRGGLINRTDEYGQPISMRDQLSQAYSMACNLDPSIRTPSKDTRQAERVKAAQKVGVVTKSPAGHLTTDNDEPISSFIEKTWENMSRSG